MGQLMITKHDDIFTGVSLTEGVPGWKFSGVISRRSLHGGVADTRAVFLNRQAANRYPALASIIPGRKR
jgi:hypothetical protein